MSKLHREEVWYEGRVIEMEIMMMTKYRKCPGDWVAEVECIRRPGGGRSRNLESRVQSDKRIVYVDIEVTQSHGRYNTGN